MLNDYTRIDQEDEITGTNVQVNMIPNVRTDLLFDIIDAKLLQGITAAACENRNSLEALK